MDNKERLFLGLHLAPLFRAEIEACAGRLRSSFPDQKWVNLEHVHFTVHFLGDVSPDQKPGVISAAKTAAEKTGPIKVGLSGMGAFPSCEKPRVIWIGAAEPCFPRLQELYQLVAPPLIDAGFPAEYPQFTPHATLFRVRAGAPIEWQESLFRFDETEFKAIDKLTLFKRVPSGGRYEYVPVEQFLFRQ